MKKKILILTLLLALVGGVISISVPAAKSRVKSYYSGDAIAYQGKVIVGSVNMGGLEIFQLSGKELKRVNKLRSFRASFGGFEDFNSVVFNEEGGRLYAYLTDGRYLYKYDISNPSTPSLVNQVKDNSWDWFMGVTKTNGKIVTIGTKGVKIWDAAMQIIDSYNIKNINYPNNINLSERGDFIFNTESSTVSIFDTKTRQIVSSFNILNNETHNRKIYNDSVQSLIYVCDDEALKAFTFDGRLTAKFKHISNLGYEVAKSQINSQVLYFSDGYGIVKINKADLKPISWINTLNLGEKNGWAMGLKTIKNGVSENIVIFNNSNIIVLDSNLKLLGSAKATEVDESPTEGLSLSADKTRAGVNSYISLHGTGYVPNENLTISFAGQNWEITADNQGRFTKIIQAPNVLPVRTDIKVTGKVSGLSYSLGFQIE